MSQQARALVYDDLGYEEDAYFINDQMVIFGPTSKDPIRIIGAKVKGIQ